MNKYQQAEGGTQKGKITPMRGECDLCRKADLAEVVDGATRMGPWANMCLPCSQKHGVGLGVGRGQRYERVLP